MQSKDLLFGVSALLAGMAIAWAVHVTVTRESEPMPLSEVTDDVKAAHVLAFEHTTSEGIEADEALRALTSELGALRAEVYSHRRSGGQGNRADEAVHELATLRQELTTLKREVGALVRELAEREPRVLSELVPGYDPADEQRALIDAEDHLYVVETSFQREDIDAEWAVDSEARLHAVLASETLRQVLDSEELGGGYIDAVHCRSTMCRIVLLHDSEADLGEFRSSLVSQVSQLFLSGSMHRIDETRTTLYLARNGHDVPAR